MAQTRELDLQVLEGTYAVCRLPADSTVPVWADRGELASVTRTPDELSIVCSDETLPPDVKAERGWRALSIQGPLDFSLVGVLADLTVPLADAGISIFVLSTYDTDHLLVRATDLERTIEVLQAIGHKVKQPLPRLETPRLLLRAPQMEDVEDLYHHFATLRGYRYWEPHHGSMEDARKHLATIINEQGNGRFLWWAVTLKEDERLVGSVSIRNIEARSKGELGYWLSQELWGQGYMTEAVQAVVRFAFTALGFHRIYAGAHPENIASIRILEKAGFIREGLFRQDIYEYETWRDSLVFGILAQDLRVAEENAPSA